MTGTNRIRVLIVDDHAVVRGGLRLFLLAFEDLDLIGEANSGERALELCEREHPDVVLMDLVMPGMNGLETTRAIRERYPQTQIVALTSFPDEYLVQDALDAGAIGYLLKNASASELAGAIRAAHAGRSTLAPEVTEALVHSSRPGEARPDLTPREREVLALMAEGMSNAEMSEQLVISLSTIKFHVSSILSKLQVSGRAEAIAFALKHHLVD